MKQARNKIKQMRALRRRGGGFTLVEMVLTCCVLVIFSGALALVMSAMQLSYVSSIETSYNRMLANNMADAVKRQLSCAQIMELKSGENGVITYINEYGEQTIALDDDGDKNINPKIAGLTYDTQSSYYIGKEAWVNIESPTDENLESFTVTVFVKTLRGSGANGIYTLKRSFQKLNAK